MLALLIAALAAPATGADTSPTADLDPERAWLVGALAIEGNDALATADIRRVIETRPRKRLYFWRERPVFDPTDFERDVERVTRLYETEGFLQTKLDWHLEARRTQTSEILSLTLVIEEGPRAVVTQVEIEPPEAEQLLRAAGPRAVRGEARARVPALEVGDPFREADYQRLEAQLQVSHLDRGHASVTTKRKAKVRPDRESVVLRYEVTPGPPARFGTITIEGLEKVDSHLVQRELTFATGDPFSLSRIEESRRRIQLLDLFASITLDWKADPENPEVAPVSIVLREKKARELRIGGGFSTEERWRAQVRWQNRNWLGDGRRLLVAGRYSNLIRSASVSFAQPHFFDRNNRALFDFALFQEDEPNYTRNSIEGVPAFERSFTPAFTGTFGIRLDTAEVRDVEQEVRDRIGGVRDEGIVIGPRVNLRWTTVDDIARPRHGLVATLDAEYSSRAFGATYDYYRLTGEIAAFRPVLDWAVVAGRLKLGAAQAFGGKERLPIFERFYAGGEGSVRGYRRHQLGPTANNGNPLGGRSLIEGSFETRIPVWRNIGVVGFLDVGQVSLDRYDFVPDELRYSAGPGISYATPIGPISLFAGFPLNRQGGEGPWQIHINIGFFF